MKQKYVWHNNETGEIYNSILSAFKTIVEDMMHCQKCRTIKMFNISRRPE